MQSFLTEQCEFGEGLRMSSMALFQRYREVQEDASDKWFHGQLKSKGFVKKTTRVPGRGQTQGYDGWGKEDMSARPNKFYNMLHAAAPTTHTTGVLSCNSCAQLQTTSESIVCM